MLRPLCVMILALSAVACGGGSDANERAPANKILARSTTDEMLPLETVQSQAPLAKPEAAASGKKGKGGNDDADAAPKDEITPAPVIESPPPTDAIGAAISGQAPPEAR